MERSDSPSDSAGSSDIDDQLARYARDMQELFQERQGLEVTSQQRRREVTVLNEFLRRHLTNLFDLETEYEALLNQLEKIEGGIQPSPSQQALRGFVAKGRAFLKTFRDRSS